MKLTIFLLCLTVLKVTASNVFSQVENITIDMQNVTVRDVIQVIEEQSGMSFMYNDDLNELNRLVSISYNQTPVKKVLEDALNQADMTYLVINDNFIVLIPSHVIAQAHEIAQDEEYTITDQVTDPEGNSLPGANISNKGTTIGTIADPNSNDELKTTSRTGISHPFALRAFSRSMEGYVRDASTGEPLIGATVYIEGTTKGTITDLNGYYTLSGINLGENVFIASYLGYEDQKLAVDITESGLLALDFSLTSESMELAEVAITVQARGQLSALNRQLNAGYVSNHISSERLQEVPDATVAESLARLPGVSVTTDAGEGNKVIIRGMNPRYSLVTVNGIRSPSLENEDNSVGLAGISPNMISGIEVQKSMTPDKDGDVIGGIVDLKLAAPIEGLHTNIVFQNNINSLSKSAFNPRANVTISNRFLENKLGVMAVVNYENINRASHRYYGDYDIAMNVLDVSLGYTHPQFMSAEYKTNQYNRERFGGRIFIDYCLPKGKIEAFSFVTTMKNDEFERSQRLYKQQLDVLLKGERVYESDNLSLVNQLNFKHRFIFGSTINAGVAYTMGRKRVEKDYDSEMRNSLGDLSSPTDYEDYYSKWRPLLQGSTTNGLVTYPYEILGAMKYFDQDNPTLFSVSSARDYLDENELTVKFDWELPLSITDEINGIFKIGYKHRRKNRSLDAQDIGADFRNGTNRFIPGRIVEGLPDLGAIASSDGRFIVSSIIDDYSESILNGQISSSQFGRFITRNALEQIIGFCDATDWAPATSTLIVEPNLKGNDYSGSEVLHATYVMAELNATKYLTITGGARLEHLFADYSAFGVSQVSTSDYTLYDFGTDKYKELRQRKNTNILPSVNAKIKPTKWLSFLLAYSQTISRPQYYAYMPRFNYSVSLGDVTNIGNPDVKPGLSHNFDAYVTLNANNSKLPNWMGVFTAGAFHKKIIGLEWNKLFILLDESSNRFQPYYELLGITDTRMDFNVYINNTIPTYTKGIELDWQSSFWSLPKPFNGIVISANFTLTESEFGQVDEYKKVTPIPGQPPYLWPIEVRDTLKVTSMFDAPRYTVNVTLGYDFKGFSMRCSYKHNSESFNSYIGSTSDITTPEATKMRAELNMFDISLTQKVPWVKGLQLFLNISNIFETYDNKFFIKRTPGADSYEKGDTLPLQEEYYGRLTIVGLRYNL
ncbi:MAG: carboxypeptidase-like regulatory domain-containing protein [Bacteroidales bacterium]|nr:carboxypeptidase-like regulatory domain-containing protein [Bacteroidales bacterium]